MTETIAEPVARRSWVEQIMGMPISVHLRSSEPGAALSPAVELAVAEVFDDLRWVDETFSTYRPSSEVMRLNRGELTADESHPAVQEVIALCEEARRRTDGAFDAHLPGPEGTRWFDPSGLVKGWAVERAALHLATLVDVDHCVNAGGDVTIGSTSATPGPWRIGVEDPLDLTRMIAVFELTEGAVATSGRTHRGLHIIDPATGAPAGRLLTATVLGASLMWADVYATAAVVKGDAAIGWLESLADHEGVVVADDGTCHVTSSLV